MTYEDCLSRVKKINSDLVDLGFSSEEIEKFWVDIFDQCEKQIKLF